MAAGKPDQAEIAVKKALELEPESAAAQTALIDLLTASGRKGGALEYVRQVKKSKPNQAFSYALESAYHMRVRDNEAALAALREGLAKTNSPALASRQFSLLFQMGRGAEASKFGDAWIKQHPQDAAFEYLLSVQDITRGDLKLAEARLKRVVGAFPANTSALNNLAWVMVQNGAKGAVEYAQRAVQLLPDNALLLDTLALALAADQQVPQALEAQRRAVELAPGDNKLRLGLGRLAAQAGDKALARSELQRLQALGSSFAEQAEVTRLLQGL